MPERRQLLTNLLRYKRFHIHVAALEAFFGEAAGLHGFLDVEPKVCNVRDKLSVRLGLIETTHDAETNPDALLLHECRNDGVQRALALCQRVGMVFLKREQTATIVQD